MKKIDFKKNILFWTGLLMFVIAAGLWAANGGFMRILHTKAAVAACTDPGCYSETWTATNMAGVDQNVLSSIYVDHVRKSCPDGSTVFTFYTSAGDHVANTCVDGSWGPKSTNPPIITSWEVNGKIVPTP